MPAVKTKTQTRSRKTGRPRKLKAARLSQPGYIVQDDRRTHVIIPIEEYERLVQAIAAHELVDELQSSRTRWVKADDVAVELAGSWLAHARKKAGLTQKELAARVGVPQSQISRIEKHPERSTLKTMRRIARALGTDLATLLSFDNDGD